jgi:3-oxoacyl-[acyl-carrier-protein] synthase III
METSAGIRSIGWWLPSARRSVAEIARINSLPLAEVARLGLVEQPVAGDGDHPSTMGAQATRIALDTAGFVVGDLDLLIFAGVTRDWPPPWVAAFGVLHELGARRAAGFDLSTRCAGVIDALWLAKALIDNGSYRTVAVCCAERFDYLFGRPRKAELATDAMYSAGAAAAIVSRGVDNAIVGFSNLVNPDLSAHQTMGPIAGGSRRPLDDRTISEGQHHWRSQLSVHDVEAIARYSADADRHNYAALRRQTGFTDIDFVVCSPFFPEPQLQVLEQLGVPRGRTLATIPFLGHIGPADLLLGLAIAIATQRPVGRRVVMSTRTRAYSNALAILGGQAGLGIAVAGQGVDLTRWRAQR